ncbi:hypothetical protein L1049_027459 [Liquidambar formosana]|uniref:Uncharacterized protein n=1 Tax=Liquidambar formosana TaxID=63359 RepID=A0AAP0RHG5_LIQFO
MIFSITVKFLADRSILMRKPCREKKDMNKGAWSKQEDEKLIDYIQKHGKGCWNSLPQAAGLLRCGRSCRLRWLNYLRPDLKRGNFSEDEEDLIIRLHALLGNRWSLIAGRLPGRAENVVKNYWNFHLKKKLIQMGIDPNNHPLSLIKSGTSKLLDTTKSQAPEAANSIGNHNQVSDSTSGPAESNTSSLPDLNIDLTISTAPLVTLVEERQQLVAPSKAKDIDHIPALPTLLLFN